MAGALYEGKYPLATALGRPLIAQLMVRVAKEHGAVAVAHGCTGKGNDQVRFDVTFQTLAPALEDHRAGPGVEVDPDRGAEVRHRSTGIEVEATKEKIFSTDQNLWGRSIEAGVLEDPWVEPPPETFQWTTDPRHAPDEPEVVEIGFDRGRPISLNGKDMDGATADRGIEPGRRPRTGWDGSITSRTASWGSSRGRSTRPRRRSCCTRRIARSSSSRSPRTPCGSRPT